jgi:hypothetical protein
MYLFHDEPLQTFKSISVTFLEQGMVLFCVPRMAFARLGRTGSQ